ncbi:MAG TPA: adenylate kinase [Oculatellaceae cyanobacterium]
MRILFLGAPGSGKGTQCKKLAENLKLAHLSSGDLLREAVALGTEAGKTAKGYMDNAQFVPDNVLIDMFRDKLKSKECEAGFILDGFPRNLKQAKALDEMLTEINQPLTAVIDLQIDNKLLSERITGRRICTNKTCNAVYHISFSPAKTENVCDLCGAPLMQRSDDKAELVDKRLKDYREQTEPLVDFYDQKLLLRTVDAQGNPDTIFSDILRTIGKKNNSGVTSGKGA